MNLMSESIIRQKNGSKTKEKQGNKKGLLKVSRIWSGVIKE